MTSYTVREALTEEISSPKQVPEKTNTLILRTEKSLNSIMGALRQELQALIGEPTNRMTNIGIATNKTFLNVLKKGRYSDEKIPCNAFLCPIYTGDGGIRGDFERFEDTPMRVQEKFESYRLIVQILMRYMDLDITFILADRGIAITDTTYPVDSLRNDIEYMRQLFFGVAQEKIGKNIRIQTFTERGVPIEQITQDTAPTEGDIIALFSSYGIDFRSFINQYKILEKSFGSGGAYSICRDYLAESRYTGSTRSNEIFLNVESSSPMNTLYQIGEPGKRLIDSNLYIGAAYRPSA